MDQALALIQSANTARQKVTAGNWLGKISPQAMRTLLPNLPEEVLDLAVTVCTAVPHEHCTLIREELDRRRPKSQQSIEQPSGLPRTTLPLLQSLFSSMTNGHSNGTQTNVTCLNRETTTGMGSNILSFQPEDTILIEDVDGAWCFDRDEFANLWRRALRRSATFKNPHTGRPISPDVLDRFAEKYPQLYADIMDDSEEEELFSEPIEVSAAELLPEPKSPAYALTPPTERFPVQTEEEEWELLGMPGYEPSPRPLMPFEDTPPMPRRLREERGWHIEQPRQRRYDPVSPREEYGLSRRQRHYDPQTLREEYSLMRQRSEQTRLKEDLYK